MSSLKGQVGGIYYGDLISQGETKVELWLFAPKSSCGPAAGSWVFKLRTENVDMLDTTKKYLSWKMNTINCDGYLIKQGFRVSIESIRAKSSFLKGNNDWFFDARQVDGMAYDIKLSESSRRPTSVVIAPKLFPADSISGSRLLTSDARVVLKVIGPPLPTGVEWVWYKDSCSFQPVFRGSEFITTPLVSTTYYVRSEWKDMASSCTPVSIVVDDSSMAPDNITSDQIKICEGNEQPVSLTLSGGRLGYKAKWVWYANEISPSSRITSGFSKVEIKPKRTTTFYVRAEGPKGNSAPASITITVMMRSIPPLQIVRQPAGELCEGTMLNLSVEGGQLGDESNWLWSSISKDGSNHNLGKGASLNTFLDQSTVFKVYGDGVCGNTKEIYLDLEAKSKSKNPVFNTIRSEFLNKGRKIRTMITSGYLGAGARWVWYLDSLGRQKMAEGDQIITRSGSGKILFLRAEGDCNRTSLIRYTPPAMQKENRFFFNAGWIANTFRTDSSNLSNFYVAGGVRRLYLKIGFGWPQLAGNEGGNMKPPVWNAEGNTLINFTPASGTRYLFTGKVYPRIQTYNAGYMLLQKTQGEAEINFLLGGGFGSYDLFREFKVFNSTDGTLKGYYWSKDILKSLSGPSAEASLLLKWKWVSIMGGVNALFSSNRNTSYLSGFFGFGFAW